MDNRSSPSSCDSRSNFRAQIDEDLLVLDGPELLQFAMMFVEGALKKSRVCSSSRSASQKKTLKNNTTECSDLGFPVRLRRIFSLNRYTFST